MGEENNSKKISFDFGKVSPKKLDAGLKSGFRSLMESIASVIAVMCIFILIIIYLFGVDISDLQLTQPDVLRATIIDAVVTLVLFLSMHRAMQENGVKNGKLDKEYIEARGAHTTERDRIDVLGRPRMNDFCAYYVENELRESRSRRLSKTPFNYDVWETLFSGLTNNQIKQLPRRFKYTTPDGREKSVNISSKTKTVLAIVNNMEELDLTPEMLMYGNINAAWGRHAVPPSPEETLKRAAKKDYIPTVIFAVFTVFVVVKFMASPAWETAVYCVIKLFAMLLRGAKGYTRGFLTYSVHGPIYYREQLVLLRQYELWLGEQDKAAEK